MGDPIEEAQQLREAYQENLLSAVSILTDKINRIAKREVELAQQFRNDPTLLKAKMDAVKMIDEKLDEYERVQDEINRVEVERMKKNSM